MGASPGAPASVFGSRNTSHGRLGPHDAKGANDSAVAGYEFCASSMLGDVVVVKNSGGRTVGAANGLNGWNLSWVNWRAGGLAGWRAGGLAARFSTFACFKR